MAAVLGSIRSPVLSSDTILYMTTLFYNIYNAYITKHGRHFRLIISLISSQLAKQRLNDVGDNV